jgi:3-hydroxyacyl-[acyl-carrier-protein] dehydratase
MTEFVKIEIGIEKIMQDIPHRYPFLLVDKAIITEPFKRGIGYKNVTMNEPHFTGHFPEKPIMPGVLIIEAMAQSAALVVKNSQKEGDEKNMEDALVYFMSIENAKFRKPVVPGDVLELHVEAVQNRGTVWKFKAEGIVDGKKVAEAEFSAMFVEKK